MWDLNRDLADLRRRTVEVRAHRCRTRAACAKQDGRERSRRQRAYALRVYPCWFACRCHCQILHRFNRSGIDAIQWHPHYCAPAGQRKFFSDVMEQMGEVAGPEEVEEERPEAESE